MLTRTTIFCCLAACATLSLVGCGGGPDDMPDVGYVTGVVKVDGKPTANLMVTFQPDSGRPSYDTTNENGEYELQYNSDTSGAKVGKNLVTISTDSDGGDGNYDAGGEEPVEVIPEKYNTMATENPEMTVDVKAGNNEFNWDISTR